MNDSTSSPNDATTAAAHALDAGFADDPFARRHGRLLDPLQVVSPTGDAAGWVVPVAHGDALLGFVQLTASLGFHRYSAVAGREGSTAGSPTWHDWFDPDAALEHARELLQDAQSIEPPVLSYDRSPDRLVWQIRSRLRDGAPRTVYVAGTSAWIAPTGRSASEESTG